MSYGTGGDENTILPDSEITIRFNADNTVQGFGGCNNYDGFYATQSEGSLTIGKLATTLKYCGVSEGVDNQESDYFYILSIVSAYRIESDRLSLFYNNSQSSLTFVISF